MPRDHVFMIYGRSVFLTVWIICLALSIAALFRVGKKGGSSSHIYLICLSHLAYAHLECFILQGIQKTYIFSCAGFSVVSYMDSLSRDQILRLCLMYKCIQQFWRRLQSCLQIHCKLLHKLLKLFWTISSGVSSIVSRWWYLTALLAEFWKDLRSLFSMCDMVSEVLR